MSEDDDSLDDAATVVANRLVLDAIRDCRAIIETAVAAVPERIGGNGRMARDAILDGLVAELLDEGGYRPVDNPCNQVIFLAVEGVCERGKIIEDDALLGLFYRVNRMLEGDLASHIPDDELDDDEEPT